MLSACNIAIGLLRATTQTLLAVSFGQHPINCDDITMGLIMNEACIMT